jgi:hypothetical protein
MSLRHPLEYADTGQRGSVLLGVLLLVLAMTMIGLALYQAAVIERQQISKTETDVRAFYAADAGIHRAALDLADPPSAGLPVGALTFDGVKAALPNDNTTLWPAGGLNGYTGICFGGAACDSTVTPYRPAYLVQAKNDPSDGYPTCGTPDNPCRFWLISTSCTPGPASNPCPAGSKTARVEAKILKTVVTVPETPSSDPSDPPPLVFQWAAFGKSSIGMGGGGAVVDTYDSHKSGCTVPCPYGGTNVSGGAMFGSNGSIDLTSSVTVKGDVINTTDVPGDTSDISISSSATIQGNVQSGGTVVINSVTNPNGQSGGNGTGTSSQVTGTVIHDTASTQVTMDPLPNCGAPYTDLTGKVTQYGKNADGTCNWAGTPIAATWKYGGTTGCGNCGVGGSKPGEFTAGGGICVSFAPGNYCLGNTTFSGGTWLQVTDRTVMTFDDQFTLSGGGIANSTQLPQDLQIISTYGNDTGETKTGVTISGGSDTYATIYAPTTLAVISGGGNLYGGVMANSVSFTGGSGVHFDQYLASGDANLVNGTPGTPGTPPSTLATIYTLGTWKKVECGPSTFAC